MRKIILYLTVFFITMTMTGCGKGAGRGSKDKGEAIPVRVMSVRLENVNKTLDYVGNIKGQDEAVVYPKISGKVIEKVKDEGSNVAKGEPIVYLDRDEVGLKFEKAPVESPLNGKVGRVYVDIGSSVTTQTPIAFVADTNKAEVDLDIPEKYLPAVAIGQEAEIKVDAYPDEVFDGRVSMLSPVVDLLTRTAPIKIVIENKDHRLQSGMFANVALILEKNKDVPVIMKEAIIGKKPDTYVYVVSGDKAYFKKVKLGIRQGAYYEVLDGLKEGELVVVMGQQKLRDGATVIAEE